MLLMLGLTKKVFFADELAPIANTGFDAVAAGQTITFGGSWLASLAYSLQLYFDFSAYSDMAIGLGAMFGLRLPLNFDAPYRATGQDSRAVTGCRPGYCGRCFVWFCARIASRIHCA